MSDTPLGDGWWLASDGKYYPPTGSAPERSPNQPSRGWWQHPALIIATLLLCFPVGLVLLWLSPWKIGIKAGVTAVVLLLAGVAIATAPAETDEIVTKQEPAAETTTTTPATTEVPATTTTAQVTTTAPPTTAPPTTAAPTTSPRPTESISQANARRSAANYIEFSSFSRQGLIDQLKYEGFSDADATHGVDSLNADWDEQAAKKAADYLEFSAFSRQGLIEQLIYEGFTPAQAEHGAGTTGL